MLDPLGLRTLDHVNQTFDLRRNTEAREHKQGNKQQNQRVAERLYWSMDEIVIGDVKKLKEKAKCVGFYVSEDSSVSLRKSSENINKNNNSSSVSYVIRMALDTSFLEK